MKHSDQIMKQNRLLSLDVFRGITVALMILVNSPGNEKPYVWLDHSEWNGSTLADFVFPFFIFIVGVSLAFTLTNARSKNLTFKQLFPKIVKRSVILFSIGLLLNAFPYHFDFETIRVFGVLQRIAICYLLFYCRSSVFNHKHFYASHNYDGINDWLLAADGHDSWWV